MVWTLTLVLIWNDETHNELCVRIYKKRIYKIDIRYVSHGSLGFPVLHWWSSSYQGAHLYSNSWTEQHVWSCGALTTDGITRGVINHITAWKLLEIDERIWYGGQMLGAPSDLQISIQRANSSANWLWPMWSPEDDMSFTHVRETMLILICFI